MHFLLGSLSRQDRISPHVGVQRMFPFASATTQYIRTCCADFTNVHENKAKVTKLNMRASTSSQHVQIVTILHHCGKDMMMMLCCQLNAHLILMHLISNCSFQPTKTHKKKGGGRGGVRITVRTTW